MVFKALADFVIADLKVQLWYATIKHYSYLKVIWIHYKWKENANELFCSSLPFVVPYTDSLLKDYDSMSFRIVNTVLFAMWGREEAPMNIKIVLDTEGWVSIVVAPLCCERQKDTILLGK